MATLKVARGGPHGKDIKAGNIYREDGSVLLIAKEPFALGEMWRPGVFVLADDKEPEVGQTGELADFWHGLVPFYQD